MSAASPSPPADSAGLAEPPPPPRRRPTRRAVALWLAVLLAVGLAAVGATVRVPYVELGPGPVTDTLGTASGGAALIQIRGTRTYPTTGHLDLVTVEVAGGPPDPITLLQALRGWLDPTVAVVPQELVYPPGQTSQQINRQDTQQMTGSQQHAINAALCQLRLPTCEVVVGGIVAGDPAAGRLRVGDVILAVDGHPVSSAATLATLIGAYRPGRQVSLRVRRGGRVLTVAVPTVRNPQRPGRALIGIEPDQRHVQQFTVRIDLDNVGGPSAGLMFALGLIDRLTPGSLTGGRTVAGTGEIDDLGNVAPIGGIQQKMVAARRAGATVFLTPAGNCAEARAARPSGLRLVRVSSLAGALAALHQIVAGSGTPPSC